MSEITRVGVDLAKSVIQVNAVDAGGKLVTNRQLSRDKFLPWCAQLPAGCSVAMEACGGSHHWARKLSALGLNVKIIAAHLVAPYRLQGKGGKNDANDAATVCEAASRPADGGYSRAVDEVVSAKNKATAESERRSMGYLRCAKRERI